MILNFKQLFIKITRQRDDRDEILDLYFSFTNIIKTYLYFSKSNRKLDSILKISIVFLKKLFLKYILSVYDKYTIH